MGKGFHFGTFFLFAAFALLLVSSITAPVVSRLALYEIRRAGSTITFGALGFCQNDVCSPRTIGYDITAIVGTVGGDGRSGAAVSASVNNVTRALILHPIACGIAFFAFLIAVFSSRLGYLFASFIAAIAFLVSLAALAVDFAIFTVVKRSIDSGNYSTGIWVTLAATILLFIGSISTCFACVTERKQRTRKDLNYDNRTSNYNNNNTY